MTAPLLEIPHIYPPHKNSLHSPHKNSKILIAEMVVELIQCHFNLGNQRECFKLNSNILPVLLKCQRLIEEPH
jgi:hypothetical protein